MNEMIERVAEAIYESTRPNHHAEWEFIAPKPDFSDHWRNAAKAAIKAMREPTPKMLHAASKSMSPERRPTPKHVSVKKKHTIRYQAMVTAALEGET